MKNKRLFLAACAVAMAALLVMSQAQVGAQLPTPLPTPIISDPTPSPSPSPSPSPNPSVKPDDESRGGGPPPAQEQPPPQASPPPPVAASPGAGSPVLVVPDIPRTPAQNTAKLLGILFPVAEKGVPVDQALVLASAPFPVAGQAWYSHDYGFPRYVPFPHLHEGTDIFADFGTPIVASSPGAVAGFGDNPVGGFSVWVAADDGTGYYYTHMLGFAPGMAVGMRVDVGTVIGYVGNTGNAATTPPHLHFEIHPPIKDRKGNIVAGGATTLPDGTAHTNTPATDPKPILDAWLQTAEQRAQAFVDIFVRKFAGVARQFHFARRVDDLTPVDSAERPGELLWFSMMDPTIGAVGVARQTVLDSSIVKPPGSLALRSLEEQRLAGVRQAVDATRLKLAAITGMLFYSASPS